MPRYQNADLSFETPASWQDRTIVAHSAPAKPGRVLAPNVVVTRDPADGKESVGAYADRQLVEFARRMDGFELHQRQERTLGGLPAVELAFTWHGGVGMLQQRQVCVLVGGRTVVNVTLSALQEDFHEVEPTFNAILATVRFAEAPERAAVSGVWSRARN